MKVADRPFACPTRRPACGTRKTDHLTAPCLSSYVVKRSFISGEGPRPRLTNNFPRLWGKPDTEAPRRTFAESADLGLQAGNADLSTVEKCEEDISLDLGRSQLGLGHRSTACHRAQWPQGSDSLPKGSNGNSFATEACAYARRSAWLFVGSGNDDYANA